MGVFLTKYLNREKMDINAAHKNSGELEHKTKIIKLHSNSSLKTIFFSYIFTVTGYQEVEMTSASISREGQKQAEI